jgi:hypothetical protein
MIAMTVLLNTCGKNDSSSINDIKLYDESGVEKRGCDGAKRMSGFGLQSFGCFLSGRLCSWFV